MKRLRSLPGAALAVGAFVLTVLLGLGGTSASALWQQSATASMTVTASNTWPGPAFSLTCTGLGAPNRSLFLNYSLTDLPRTLTYSASLPDGTFSDAQQVIWPGFFGSVFLDTSSAVLAKSVGMNEVTIRMTATYYNQTQASSEITIRMDAGTGNRKIYCP
ncbi:hypothetical protein ASF72_07155 [Arthrobacter sp. Leaf141]|uniref:hypothetical protein n=1 Tax=Arthrobacter sp. Leaf141 TaxID=1736273 RepID=UPI0006F4E571|nr:hypothetical protein [Arthrobacter sp. Leaf141]KQR02959.1 hypothetical protein ASF72_07155 [Arthrobacter sp. Leaf141]